MAMSAFRVGWKKFLREKIAAKVTSTGQSGSEFASIITNTSRKTDLQIEHLF